MTNWFTKSLLRRLLIPLVAVAITAVGVWLLQKRGSAEKSEGTEKMIAEFPSTQTVPPLPIRTKLLSETSHESIEETIEQLPSFLDWALATSMGLNSHMYTECYGRARLAFPRLNRVRKLLGEISNDRKPHYVALFLRKIEEALDGYPESWREAQDRMNQPDRSSVITEPQTYDRKWATAGALTYVLTEWNHKDALPTFARMLEQPNPSQSPVSALFVPSIARILLDRGGDAGKTCQV